MKRLHLASAAAVLALAACNNNAGGNNAADNTLAVDNLVVENSDLATTAATGNIDQAFLTDAIKGDNGEIALGQMAQQKGASQDVKDFGQTLVTDHTNAKQQAAALAQQAGMTVPDGMKDEQTAEQTKLEGLTGAAFDKEFARFSVDAHQKDIAKFQQQANGTGPTADLAKQTLPVLQKHLQVAQGLK